MAIQRDTNYPGRFDRATTGQPQGAFKNRTSPSSQDGSYMEKAWLNDWSGFMSSLLAENNITPNGAVDAVGSSQYFQGMLQLRQVNPLNNDWNGFFDPEHQVELPSPAGYPLTSRAGGTVYGLDDEWSFGNYSSAAANNISSDDDGVIFSVGTYKLFNFTSDQLTLIDVNDVPVYIVDQAGTSYFVNNSTVGVNVTKPDSTTLKVELTNTIFATLGITKVWQFFTTGGVGYVPTLDPDASGLLVAGSVGLIQDYVDVSLSRAPGVSYTNTAPVPILVKVARSMSSGSNSFFVEGSAISTVGSTGAGVSSTSTHSVIVPPGKTYSLENTGTPVSWFELRLT